MDTKKNRRMNILILLLVLNLLVSAAIIYHLASEDDGTGRYTIYIGTNDKDTYTQLIPSDEARRIVDRICMEHTDAFTMTDARGSWTDETGAVTREDTLVYTFSGIDEEDLNLIMDDILEELNQNSIMVEHQNISTTYYDGSR